ncbi:MAG: NAD-dependent succinate-semialdehyde dehydrogenase [Melioribacteraceae bacterium]|nr:NAD-dependent succinate-semialdehyde dehydrogenase [Melioribacteraceae bacterium]
MAIQSINPATGKLIKTYESFNEQKIDNIISKSFDEFLQWKKVSFSEKKKLMLNAAKYLKGKKQFLGEIITTEMGKPIKQSIAEIEKCSWVCEYYAENAELILKNEIIETDASESYVEFNPLGIVLAVMPWNFPFWQVFRFAAPALMAGNVGLLKHASNVPQCSIEIEKVFYESGFPEYVFKNLLIESSQVKKVLENEKVMAATLTGSEYAGSIVAQSCGKLIKKTVLELGGSDPFVVLEDANLIEAAKIAVTARLINNGQSCIAAKRFIVVEKIYDEFEKLFVNEMKKIKVGDPMNYDIDLGPIAREDLLYELQTQINKSVEAGATILIGGKRIDKEGFYFEPTIISDVNKSMPAYKEEIFGPVATLIKAKDENEAIEIANDSEFGLGASLWTNNLNKSKQLASQIQSGSVFINGMVKSDPRLPFGGIKKSGYGRELSHYGIKEFVNIKSVWIK